MLAHRSQKLKSLQQHLEAYAAETEQERLKLEQEKAGLKRKEDTIRETLQAEYDKKVKELQETVDKKEEELQESRDELEAERRDWEEEKERVKQTKVFEKVVTLDVGGTKYRTTLSTLTKYPDSMLGAMFSGRHDLPQQEDGSYFIDRDGEVFKYILMYVRDEESSFAVLPMIEKKQLTLLAFDAQYFQLAELETKARLQLKNHPKWQLYAERYYEEVYHEQPVEVEDEIVTISHPKDHKLDYGCTQIRISQSYQHEVNITFREVPSTAFRVRGLQFLRHVCFKGCDFSCVTFRNCYFQKGISFEGCILRGTKFEHVGGLVSHKVHFAPWQVAQADFEPELLQALKDNGCIY